MGVQDVPSRARARTGIETSWPYRIAASQSEHMGDGRCGSRTVLTATSAECRLSGRTMARSGLRMMPTFPSSPLRFRTAGFLRTAPKLAYQTGPSLITRRLSLLPAYPLHDAGSPPSFVLSAAVCIPRTESEATARWNTAILQGPSLRSGLCCPGPSPLNRPHPPHSQAHRNFIALRLICDASLCGSA